MRCNNGRLTVTKVVFEYRLHNMILEKLVRLTVTKVVFESNSKNTSSPGVTD